RCLSASRGALVLCKLAFFSFIDAAPHETYTLSLHDALPIFGDLAADAQHRVEAGHRLLEDHGDVVAAHPLHLPLGQGQQVGAIEDRKSTRLNSSHVKISYAVFCLKKKNTMTAIIWYNNKHHI